MKVAYCTVYVTQEFYCSCRYYVTANIITMEYDQLIKKPCKCFANGTVRKSHHSSQSDRSLYYNIDITIEYLFSSYRCSSSDTSNVCCFVSVGSDPTII